MFHYLRFKKAYKELFLHSIYLRNFRNFEEASLIFGSKINVFFGQNAQGKTNLLEAIFLISTGRSFRTQHFSELIREGSSFFFIEAQISRDQVLQTIRLSYDGHVKKVECNSTSYPSFQSLLGLLPSVLFQPGDLDIISGSPSNRRRFLNLHLSQSNPLYFHHLVRFWRAMKQRNLILRLNQMDGIECWEKEMASSAAFLVENRKNLLKELNDELQVADQYLCKERTLIQWIPSQPTILPFTQSYLAQLQKNRSREKQFGMTLTGPHRDDFSIQINEKSARQFASDGQKRTAIAALRLSEWKRLQKQIESPPLFGIDDLEIHLDHERQQLFRQATLGLGQVFITTPHTDSKWPDAKEFHIHAGAIQE